MNRFSYARATDVEQAIAHHRGSGAAAFLAGGTNLVDLIKENVARPTLLVDITRLPLKDIQATPAGGIKIGALVTNSAVAYHEQIAQCYPLLAKAILAGASAQIRNVATVGGNLLQRTRCHYFYDTGTPCNKREPGSGCPALEGVNRIHAILGTSEQCIAVHPSDMCVALAALDAVVHLAGESGARVLPFANFHRLAGDTPQIDTNLEADEIITAVELPPAGFADHHAYTSATLAVSVPGAASDSYDAIKQNDDGLYNQNHVDIKKSKLQPGTHPTSVTQEMKGSHNVNSVVVE